VAESERKEVLLTRRQQDLLAALMQRLSPVAYRFERDSFDAEGVGGEVADWLDAMQVKSQELGQLYEVMHRTGHNA
jgi:hypothetical protein